MPSNKYPRVTARIDKEVYMWLAKLVKSQKRTSSYLVNYFLKLAMKNGKL